MRHVRPGFVAVVSDFQARGATAADVEKLRAYIDQAGVLVLKDQAGLDDDALLSFAGLLGPLYQSIAAHRTDLDRRLESDFLSDISNVERDGSLLSPNDMRRIQQLSNLLWHTDNSFRSPAGGYTMLAARVVPERGGETEFADTRAAYDALTDEVKRRIDDLQVEHSIAHARRLAGTEGIFDAVENDRFPPSINPLVRTHPRTGTKSLYIGMHAARVIGWPDEEGADLLEELLEFSTQSQFVYRHSWTLGDLVVWDNTSTLHRALPFEDTLLSRDLRRAATMLAE